MDSNLKVSFDFDGTLDRKDVQEYALELLKKGVDVRVCTFRLSDEYQRETKIVYSNDDLWYVINSLGIPKEKVIFTNMEDKSKFLDKSFVWHLDDDHYVHNDLKGLIPSIDVQKSSYKQKCNRLLYGKENIN